MGLSGFFTPILRWWWILVIAVVLAAGTSYVVTARQPPVYQARTTLMIGRTIFKTNPDSGSLYLEQQLAAIYADFAYREPIRKAVMQELGLDALPNYQARNTPNTQLVEISVTDTDPQLAQAVANALAKQLISQSPGSSTKEDLARQKFINDQLTQLENQIKETQTEIRDKQAELPKLTSARQISDANTQIAALQEKLRSLQSIYADLLANTEQGISNTISIIEEAELPTYSISPNKVVVILLASMIGLVLAALAAYGIEALDDTIKTPKEAEALLKVPVIGHIPKFPPVENKCSFVMQQPLSPISDAFRLLRTNLEFFNIDSPIQSILITASDASDGKTTIAANLAFIMSQAEKKIILVDGDLRRPMVNKVLNIKHSVGLSDLAHNGSSVQDELVDLNEKNLRVLSAGVIPPNPTEILASARVGKIFEELETISDLVIVDGPPFTVADALVLASRVDGVLVVVRSGFTRREAARQMMEQLQRTGTRVIGVVMNEVSRSYSYYYYNNYSTEKKVDRRSKAKMGEELEDLV